MSTSNHLTIREANETDTAVIATLAHAIWPVTYGEILSAVQLQYMLGLFYEDEPLLKQMKDGHRFYIAEISSEPVGFLSISHDHTVGAFKIHKIYVHQMVQGKGVGKKLLEKVEEEVKKAHANIIRLDVNRNNKARGFYERAGFSIVGEKDTAIGEGYFMEDYIMEKKI